MAAAATAVVAPPLVNEVSILQGHALRLLGVFPAAAAAVAAAARMRRVLSVPAIW